MASTEMAKALIREVLLLVARITDSTGAAILTIMSHKAYYAARRSRVHQGPEVPPDTTLAETPSGFARLFPDPRVLVGTGDDMLCGTDGGVGDPDDRLRRRMPKSGSGNSISRMARNTSSSSLCSAHSGECHGPHSPAFVRLWSFPPLQSTTWHKTLSCAML